MLTLEVIVLQSFHSTPCLPPSGGLHVHPWRCGEHLREPANGLALQNLAGGAQPAGAVLGAATEGLPPPPPPLYHAAAQPGPHTRTDRAAEMTKARQRSRTAG